MSNLLDLVGLLRLASPAPSARAGGPRRAIPAGAFPTERVAMVKAEEVDLHRWLGCPTYEACLDAAYHREWKSWSCQRCRHFTSRAPRRPRASWRRDPVSATLVGAAAGPHASLAADTRGEAQRATAPHARGPSVVQIGRRPRLWRRP